MLFDWSPRLWALVIATAAFALLMSGRYTLIQRVLVGFVVFMSCVFLLTTILMRPSLADLASGLVPAVPDGSALIILALIGTTVVPYNLFLHAAAVQEKWPQTAPTEESVRDSRLDTAVAVGLGGLITIAVVVNATTIDDASSLARIPEQLEPVLGSWASTFFGLGLFAAGLTSAITAPLAAAYATSGALGWDPDLKSVGFRVVLTFVIVTGLVFALVGASPTEAIVLAQAANGLLLPVIAAFLLFAVNNQKLMGAFRNRPITNLLGATVVLVVTGLGGYQLLGVFGAL
jgi:Mn2+/Fe2+ NRAMP family transporter